MRDRFKHIRHPAVVYVCGRRGQGKSYTAIELINEWDQVERAAGVAEPGRVHVVDPVGPDPASDPRYLNHYGNSWSATMIDQLPEGTNLLVIDEADLVLGNRADQQHPVAMDLVRRGRHRGVTVCLCVQRPSEVTRTAWALADVLITHRTTDSRDLDRLASLSDAQDLIAAAPGLPTGAAVVWTPEETTVVDADDKGRGNDGTGNSRQASAESVAAIEHDESAGSGDPDAVVESNGPGPAGYGVSESD